MEQPDESHGRGDDAPLAHLRIEEGRLEFHPLDEHLNRVSILAGEFAARFGAREWAALAGLWHDLGKYRGGFQRYIRQAHDPDAHVESPVARSAKTHSAAGALWAEQYLARIAGAPGRVMARILAYLVAGHHAGLDDWDGGLKVRLSGEDAARELADTLAARPPEALLGPALPLPDLRRIPADRGPGSPERLPGRFALWVRMLFSCLVDADFLDTEAFMDPGKGERRRGFLPLDAMERALADELERLRVAAARRGEADTPVNRRRAAVLQSCLAKAGMAPGVFTLTVPTGGGKTLSSLAFALRHAVLHGKDRIIYAIPYTSIIEQTADIFRRIFGEANVVEHHSNVEAEPGAETARSRLACENWDAPLIVTTNVQLLESLFASRTSRCRKLHNLANSVIVLDEAQLLPVPYLQPVLDVLRLLVKDYGVTLVLCTATQPALASRACFDPSRQLRGFRDGEVVEIIDDVPGLYRALERVRVHVPAELGKPRPWEEIASDIARHDAVLAVVSRRADARTLYSLLKPDHGDGLWHLSGLMCAQHRSDVIGRIKAALHARREALARGEEAPPIRVVSTQLVEAGVDLDFPVVYRAIAGLDSIAQAAGRCNREGRLARGDVHVFVPPTPAPPGLLRQAEQTTRTLWGSLPAATDPLGVERFPDYFRNLYGDGRLDEKGICRLLEAGPEADVKFRSAAEAFRLIDDKEAATVFVRYRSDSAPEGIDGILGLLEKEGPDRWLLRKLQRYGVTVYKNDLERLLSAGDVAPVAHCPGLYVQASDILYHPVLGLDVAGAPGDPAGLIG